MRMHTNRRPALLFRCAVFLGHWIRCQRPLTAAVGEQGLFQMANFTSGGKDRVVLIFNIEPFFTEIADLLGEPRRTG